MTIKRTGLLGAACALLLASLLAVGSTSAYLMSKTDTYVNSFFSGLPAVGNLVISGTKVLEGRSLACGEFQFELYETDGDFVVKESAAAKQIVKNEADGGFSFDELEYTKAGVYHYVVSEQIPLDYAGLPFVTYDETEYHITVTVAEENNTLVVQKTMVACEMPVLRQTAEELPLIEAGEVLENADDPQSETALSSQDEADSAEVQLNGTETETITFTNTFSSPDAVVVVNGLKIMDGRELKVGEFSFELYQTDETYYVAEDAIPVQSVKNLSYGTVGGFGFLPLSYSDEGVFYYVISEDMPSTGEDGRGVTYDDTSYRLRVEVQRNSVTGILSAGAVMFVQDDKGDWAEAPEPIDVESASNENFYVVIDPQNSAGALAFVTFENAYFAEPVSFELAGEVDLEGRVMVENEFSFVVEPVDNAPSMEFDRGSNNAVGAFSFGEVEFAEPGIYEYVIKQDASAQLDGVTYDESVYRVVLTVVDDGEGNLVIEGVAILRNGVEVTDGSGVKYLNVYKENEEPENPVEPNPDTPVDPDPDNPDTPDGPDPDNPVDPDPDTPDGPDPDNPVDPDPDTPDGPDPDNPDGPDPDDPDPDNPEGPDPDNPANPDGPGASDDSSSELDYTGDNVAVTVNVLVIVAMCAFAAGLVLLYKSRKDS